MCVCMQVPRSWSGVKKRREKGEKKTYKYNEPHIKSIKVNDLVSALGMGINAKTEIC